jgi:hypothetical protein
MMSRAGRLAWRVAAALARLLEPSERRVVFGDLHELQHGGGRALWEVAGLVARRQVAAWAAPGAWLALVTIAIPAGVLLSHVTRGWSDGSAVYVRLYIERFTWSYVDNPGTRYEMLSLVVSGLVKAAALATWGWSTGFVLATFSRRALCVTGAVFAAAVVLGTIGSTTTARVGYQPMTDHFYLVVLPRVYRLAVLLSAWAGVRRGLQGAALGPSRAAAILIAVAALGWWTAVGVERSVTFGRAATHGLETPGPDNIWGTSDDVREWPLRLLPLVLAWPALVAAASSLRPHRT